ncbi:TonB-dependent receptor [Novimethylophilus kurashikiensis]|uniref:TonB-dependent receptor n=1 Tax=Novimethylophilus kurashikiensis TaxID=1825523 RepID=A0A2R5F4S2_9PROT|nr:hypothetical protein [Novimethylophilus kurashikiensis]GBG13396.1 TonB-dependent receptor [Novimethylophilus kurashikiensis]
MKISESTVLLASSHQASEQHSVKQSLRVWSDRPASSAGNPSTVVNLSDQGKVQASSDSSDEDRLDPKLKVLVRIVEAFLGRKIKLVSAADLQAMQAQGAQNSNAAPASTTPQRLGWGMQYDQVETHSESEQTSFAAQGVIKTADGKEIQFDLQLSMARSFQSQDSLSVQAGDAPRTKDPLVINFDGTAAELTSTKFSFDLNSDGTQDQMSFVGPGSGFLALDLNGNGKIDDGSELFGAKSGNGFADLAKYDGDGNHWIDENDAVFAKLLVWSKDAQGQDKLQTLAQRNVGALYLGSVATPFSAKDAENQLQGQVRSSGVYLQENGAVGTLQQVDLAV